MQSTPTRKYTVPISLSTLPRPPWARCRCPPSSASPRRVEKGEASAPLIGESGSLETRIEDSAMPFRSVSTTKGLGKQAEQEEVLAQCDWLEVLSEDRYFRGIQDQVNIRVADLNMSGDSTRIIGGGASVPTL